MRIVSVDPTPGNLTLAGIRFEWRLRRYRARVLWWLSHHLPKGRVFEKVYRVTCACEMSDDYFDTLYRCHSAEDYWTVI